MTKPLVAVAILVVSCLPLRAQDFDGHEKAHKPALDVRKDAPKKAAAKREEDPRAWVSVDASDARTRTRITEAGVSIEEVQPGKVGGIATAKAIDKLRAQGFTVSIVPLSQRFGALDFPTEDTAFHNYAELEADMRSLAAKAKGLASMYSIGSTTKGRKMWALRLNTTVQGDGPSDKPGIIFLGTHHAREHLSTEVPLLLAKHLVENKDKPEIKALLAARDIYIIPMVNPDGVEYDIRDNRYHMHRKNVRDNGDGTVGVDLNRNYGWGWGGGGSSDDPDSDIYRGPSAFSEPETKAVKAFVDRHASNVKVLLSYHTFSELILYPWGGSDEQITDTKALSAFKAMAQEMAGMTGYTPEQSSDLYIATGDTCDWAWGEHKIFAFTFELTPKSMWAGGFYPGAKAIQPVFQANLRPALYLINLADDPLRAAQGPAVTAVNTTPAGGR